MFSIESGMRFIVCKHQVSAQQLLSLFWHHWLHYFSLPGMSQRKVDNAQYSATGTRTRVARVRAEYPNQLDYSGHVDLFFDILLCMYVAMFLASGEVSCTGATHRNICRCMVPLGDQTGDPQKNCLHFSICACHPCAGAMLIFSVSFQF